MCLVTSEVGKRRSNPVEERSCVFILFNMYCPNCNQEHEGKFCPECGTKLIEKPSTAGGFNLKFGDANAISGGVNVSDSHNVHNEDKSVHNISNVTHNVTQVAAQKTEMEILQEKKALYLNECKRAYEDNVLERSEVIALEEYRIKIGLDKVTADAILDSVRVMTERNARKTTLSPVAKVKLQMLTDNLQKNEVKALMDQIDGLEALVNKFEHEELSRKYFLVLAALKPEKCISLKENSRIDSYWKSFWSYLAYIKVGNTSKAEDVLATLDRFADFPEDNMTVLAAAGALMKGKKGEAKAYLKPVPGDYTPALQRFVDSIYLILDPKTAQKMKADVYTCAFYLVNFFGQEDPKERERREREEQKAREAEERRLKAEAEAKRRAEEAKRRAEERARLKAEEAARKKAEEEARLKREEEERKRKEKELARKKAEQEAKRKAEQERARKEAEERRKREEAERIRIEQERARKEAEERRKREEEERRLKEEQKRREEEARRRAAEEAARRKAEEEAKYREREKQIKYVVTIKSVSNSLLAQMTALSVMGWPISEAKLKFSRLPYDVLVTKDEKEANSLCEKLSKGGIVVILEKINGNGHTLDSSVFGIANQDRYDVVLKDGGANKLLLIKELMRCANLGLKEAKDMVDGVPSTLKKGVNRVEALKIKQQLEDLGAEVTLNHY